MLDLNLPNFSSVSWRPVGDIRSPYGGHGHYDLTPSWETDLKHPSLLWSSGEKKLIDGWLSHHWLVLTLSPLLSASSSRPVNSCHRKKTACYGYNLKGPILCMSSENILISCASLASHVIHIENCIYICYSVAHNKCV